MKRQALALAFVIGSLSGCQCNCANTVEGGVGGGKGGGSGKTDGGTGGGDGGSIGGGTGGSGGGFTIFDAGDGTTTNIVPPGSFNLDGGSADGGPGEQGTGVKVDPNGFIVLNTGSNEFYFMWIANNDHNWVSKFDTRTGKEVGRYWSVINRDCYSAPGMPKGQPCPGARPNGLRGDNGNNPSRTALDLNGDVWIANRAIGIQGSVTKIANAQQDCIDRNGNGKIDTSTDLNADGEITGAEMITPTDWDDPLQYDECVLFSTPLGTNAAGDVAIRALAVSIGDIESNNGFIWAGNYHDKQFHKLDALSGQPLAVNSTGAMTIDLSWGMYGAIVDSKGRLWAVYPGAAWLARIDTVTGTLVSDMVKPPAGLVCGSYALGIDGKDRVWLPGLSAGAVACRYDPATDTWTSFSFATAMSQINTPFGSGRGIAADDKGNIYMSAYLLNGALASQLIRFDAETGVVKKYGNFDFIDATDANTSNSIGVGIDGDGQPWINNSSGNAMRIDNITGGITRTKQQPGGLYTYSDFTGYQLRKFTAPRGTYYKDFKGCATDSEWRKVIWDADVPPNTQVQVYVRVANTAADLPMAMRYGPFTTSPADLAAANVPKGLYFRVEFVLSSSDGKATPVLKSFRIVWACGGVIN
jgi:hypothetical protein